MCGGGGVNLFDRHAASREHQKAQIPSRARDTSAMESDAPAAKKAKFEGDSPKAASDGAASAEDELAPRSRRANDVMQLVFGVDQCEEPFRPPYTHQIFENEMLHGYDNSLQVILSFAPCSLRLLINIHYEFAAQEHTDILGKLSEKLEPGSYFTDQQSFDKAEAQERFELPKGLEQHSEYSAGDRHFVLYHCKELAADPKLRAWHKRMQFIMYLNIENASYIADDDPRWELLLVLEKNTNHFVGYTTVYRFSSALKERGSLQKFGLVDRFRLSQIVVLPTFRSQGHAVQMLQAMYEIANKGEALEVAIEDPSPRFCMVRDVVDFSNAVEKGLIQASLQEKEALAFVEQPALVREMHETLKITPKQARRILEIDILRHVDAEDPELYKQYRLFLKRRLWQEFHHNQVLTVFSPEEKKQRLTELYQDLESEYAGVLERVAKHLSLAVRFVPPTDKGEVAL